MDDPSEIQQRRVDELPRSAVADSPLSLDARTPGPRGVAPKLGLAALAVVLLLAMVGGLLVLSHFSPAPRTTQQDAQLQTR